MPWHNKIERHDLVFHPLHGVFVVDAMIDKKYVTPMPFTSSTKYFQVHIDSCKKLQFNPLNEYLDYKISFIVNFFTI